MSEPLIPRPPLEDRFKIHDGKEVVFNRDNAVLVFHEIEQYRDFDHLFIRKIGEHGLRIFNIHVWSEYLIDRGYDILIKQYPDDVTVAVWTEIQMQSIDDELKGKGHELED